MKSINEIYKNAENKILGLAAAPGVCIGKAYLFNKEKLEINGSFITDVDEAKQNLTEALEKSKKELSKIFAIAKEKMEEKRAAIFEAHMMILDDPILISNIIKRIETERRQPEFIVDDEISKYQNLMITSVESYMKERAHDIEDIKNRIIRNLQKKRWQSRITNEVIVVSESLTPADTILFSRSNVKGYVTDHGGLTSHAAIISRSLNIPAVVGTHFASQKIKEGDTLIIDGFHGVILVDPNEAQVSLFKTKIEKLEKLQKELADYKDKPAVTLDGKEIGLYANVDVTGEIELVIANGAKGIGLFRTEQLLEELGEFPTEEEQTEIYHNLAQRIYPDIAIIRAFDIGGDKVRLLNISEANPFLGLRGIRFLLENLTLFKSQIKAVFKASKNKNIYFMLPMITTIKEIHQTKKLIKECKNELKKEKISFDDEMKIGIMIEVPSAAVMTKEFAKEVDFISIGTNDLIQYLVAVDRGNDLVSHLYQEFNPAVLRTLKHIVVEGKKAGTSVSLCGEMAANTLAIPLLVGLGLDTLSMSPSTLHYAKRIIRNISYKKAEELAGRCLEMHSEEEVIKEVEEFFKINSIQRTRQII